MFLLSGVVLLVGAGKVGLMGHEPGLCPGGIITAFLLKSISVFPKNASCRELQMFTIYTSNQWTSLFSLLKHGT